MRSIQYRDGHPAIYVKHYGCLDFHGATEDEAQAIYDAAQESWWRDAEDEAHRLGFDGIFAAGRSGGWMQPFWQSGGPFGGYGHRSWGGMGGTMGCPRYPDMDTYRHRRKVEALARRLWKMLDKAQDYIDAVVKHDKANAR